MTSAVKVSSAVTTRYAGALIDLAQEAKVMDKVEKDLHDLLAMIKDSADLSALIYAPVMDADQQRQALNMIAEAAKFQDLTKNFLSVLAMNRRLPALEPLMEVITAELLKRRGEVAVEVTTAQDLSAAQLKALQASLSKGMGHEVKIKAKVEPSILGGMIVTIGSRMIDNSVARKLERLQSAMGAQANENTNTTQTTVNTKEA